MLIKTRSWRSDFQINMNLVREFLVINPGTLFGAPSMGAIYRVEVPNGEGSSSH